MKTNKTKERPNFEEFYVRVKHGLANVEQDKRGYGSVNPTSGAMGKYQFLPEWLDGPDGIKAFAKKNPVFGKVETPEDFINNPELQEAFFKEYAKTTLYDNAVEALKGSNPLNLSLDVAGAMFHYDSPQKARQQIRTGKLKEATKAGVNGAKHDNLSGADYQKKYIEGLTKLGLKPLKKTYSEEDRKSITEDFEKKIQDIDNLDVDDNVKGSLKDKVYQDVVNNGHRDIVNEHLEKTNKEGEERFETLNNEFQELLDVFEKVSAGYSDEGVVGKNLWFERHSREDTEQINRLNEKYKFLKHKDHKYNHFPDKNKPVAIVPDKFVEAIQSKYKEMTGEEISLTGEDGLSTVGKSSRNYWDKLTNWVHEKISGHENIGKFNLKDNTLRNIEGYKKRPLISEEYFPEPEINNIEGDESDDDKKSDDRASKIDEPEAEAKDVSDVSASDEFFNTELYLDSIKEKPFNYSETKRELPIDTVMGLTLGLIGDAQAKEANIPLRTEEVSEAIKVFTADLAKRSKEGLPVEVEAALRNKLADAAQGALKNIVNASAGNRATILGNLGQIENTKAKGLIDIQLADHQAKSQAFKEYGEALKYMNDFDSRRDIANHALQYSEEVNKREKGEKLAEAGWGQMIEGIKYQRDNGPGSANDMLRSFYMQQAFGFDPNMKDNGNGDTPGTESYKKKKELELLELSTKRKDLSERKNRFNPNQKAGLDKFITQTKNLNDVGAFMDYVEKNPNLDYENISMDNIDVALKEGNFGLLHTKSKTPGIINLSQKELEDSYENPYEYVDHNKEKIGLLNGLNAYGRGVMRNENGSLRTPEEQTALLTQRYQKENNSEKTIDDEISTMNDYYNNQ